MADTEVEEVAALIRTAFAGITVALDPAPSGLRVSATEVTELLAKGGGAVWDEGELRGCVLWRPVDRGLYLSRLAVASGWQRRGIARALIGAVEAAARRQRAERVLLEVRLALVGNRRLFAECGFVETALRSHEGYSGPTFVEAEKGILG